MRAPLNMYEEHGGSFELPHPPIDISVLIILEDAIRAAWQLLRDSPPEGLNLTADLEEPINFHLHEALEDRVWNRGIVDGFDEYMFRSIQHAPEVCNFSRKELKKRPDMLVKITGRPSVVKPTQDGIFIECKPVDANHSLTSQYCNRGITRFVVGRYAWAMTQAMMVGYTQKEHDIVSDLTGAFAKRANTVCTVTEPTLCVENPGIVITEHKRRFDYLQTGRPAPAITIRHLWLRRD
jgi:hypothetical protein